MAGTAVSWRTLYAQVDTLVFTASMLPISCATVRGYLRRENVVARQAGHAVEVDTMAGAEGE
jgi:hypothetical protein